MGLRSRIKQKIMDRLKNFRALWGIIKDEANHPGRPQPHMAARNPLYGGEEEPQAPKKEEPPSPKPASTNSSGGDDDFWYLRGDDEGWSDPNPGQK